MGCGSGAIDSSLQPMLAEAYDNLLERKQKEEKFVKEIEMDLSDDISENTLDDENNVKLTIETKEDKILEKSDTKINETKINSEEDTEGGNEEAHNKYTRVFSLGNMAMNVGFITGKNNNKK